MKILIVTDEYPPARCGGIGVFYFDLAARLRAAGAQVRVVVSPPSAGADGEGGVERPTEILRRRWTLFQAARRAASEFEPDLVETHDWAGPTLAAPRRPLIVRLHGAHTARAPRPSRFWRVLEGRALAAADAHVAVSEWIARRTAAAFRLRDPIPVIPSGVDTKHFAPPARPRMSDEILYVGSPRADKGIAELVEAVGRVFERRPAATLTLAGGSASHFEPWLSGLPGRLRARVRCLGRVSREALPELYGRAALCVSPSHAEALGLVCLEAMSTAAAVVASTRGGATELIEHGRSGLLADPLAEGALAAAIESLLGAPERRRRLGEAARARVLARYDLSLTTARNLAFYEDLCSRFAHSRHRAA